MRPEEARKLIGGYAAGILTPEERRALMEAALEDQELFDELAREHALREVLGDAAARRRLLAAVEDAPSRWAWLAAWARRPVAWGVASGLAAAAVLVGVLVWPTAQQKPAEPVLTAMRSNVPEAPGAPAAQTVERAKDAAGSMEADKAARGGAREEIAAALVAPKATVVQKGPPTVSEAEMKSLAAMEKGRIDVTAPAPPPPMAASAAAVQVPLPSPEPGAPAGVAAPRVSEERLEMARAAKDEGAANEVKAKAAPAVPAAEVADARQAKTVTETSSVSVAPAGGVVGGLTGALPVRSQGAVAGRATFRADAAAPIPYRLEVADAAGKWAAAPSQAGFRKEDRVRVVFEAKEAGRLRVVTSAAKVLLDADVRPGVAVNVEIPAGEAEITGSFRNIPFEIQLRRLP